MLTYSSFNDAKNYRIVLRELNDLPVPVNPAFILREGEEIRHTIMPRNFLQGEELNQLLDGIDIAVVEEIARSKYLTSLQIFELITMRGFVVSRLRLRKRVQKLMKLRVIRESEIIGVDAVRGIKYFQLDVKGFVIAKKQGIEFHMGNRYLSYLKAQELGIRDTVSDVKRILVGNQIVTGLLINGARMERFGIMETFRLQKDDYQVDNCIIRTAANVRIDKASILMYEVVRDSQDAYEKLADKVQRYYFILRNRDYLDHNYYGDRAYAQLVICGESFAHNLKLVSYLKKRGLWNCHDTLLFTEDLLNIRDSLRSIYEIRDDGKQVWYELPEEKASRMERMMA